MCHFTEVSPESGQWSDKKVGCCHKGMVNKNKIKNNSNNKAHIHISLRAAHLENGLKMC